MPFNPFHHSSRFPLFPGPILPHLWQWFLWLIRPTQQVLYNYNGIISPKLFKVSIPFTCVLQGVQTFSLFVRLFMLVLVAQLLINELTNSFVIVSSVPHACRHLVPEGEGGASLLPKKERDFFVPQNWSATSERKRDR